MVVVKEVENIQSEATTAKTTQFYRNPTFFGVLIGVGALIVIVIVCLLLVAFRAGHLNVAKLHGMCKILDNFIGVFVLDHGLLSA